MKTLVLQLARYGDLFQTWPTLKALRRTNPENEVHLFVRERFQEATTLFDGIHVHALPSAHWLEPLIERESIEEALVRVRDLLEPLRDLHFDQIINLTFSPLSSYVSSYLAHSNTEVRGYTRHPDGHLKIPDDPSAYFYGQAGHGRDNRFSLIHLFAAVAGVDLILEDLQLPVEREPKDLLVHMGASRADRVYPDRQWQELLTVLSTNIQANIVLIGSEEERNRAEHLIDAVGSSRLKSMVGRTSWAETAALLAKAKLFVGGDSAPAQLAGLIGVPVLGLFPSHLNPFETAPISAGTRILCAETMADLPVEQIQAEVLSMWNGEPARYAVCERRSPLENVQPIEEKDDFNWRLIQALYTQNDFPSWPEKESPLAYLRLNELADLALNEMETLETKGVNRTSYQILESIDLLLQRVGQESSRAKPLVDWFQTERLRMGPAPLSEILQQTRSLFQDLKVISSVYCPAMEPRVLLPRLIELGAMMAPRLREFEFSSVNSQFQEFLTMLHQLARHSTKVGDQPWSSVLNRMDEALNRRDMIELADVIEYEIKQPVQEGMICWTGGRENHSTSDPSQST